MRFYSRCEWILLFILAATISLTLQTDLEEELKDKLPPPNRHDEFEPGEPLFLSPIIEAGQIKKAQNLSRVGPLPNGLNITSYSGFFTVNKTYNSNMFFWFFPAMNASENAPLLLWLEGGPGGSSMLGVFIEHGPLVLDKNLDLSIRKYSWASPFNMLYIDNPVGAGFSFTDDDKGYARNEDDVANNLYIALQQFFALFPDYQRNDFYISGVSYAGKYVPAIAYKIHKEFPPEIRLKGIAIGDGWIDPENMLDYSQYLYQLSLLDELQRDFMKVQENLTRHYIQIQDWKNAFLTFGTLLSGAGTSFPTLYTNTTGLNNYFNFLFTNYPSSNWNNFPLFLNKSSIRKSIHVGKLVYKSSSPTVLKFLMEDFMQSIKPWLSTLMDNYKVLLYVGQLDVIVNYPAIANALSKIRWKNATVFKNTKRIIWKVAPSDEEVAGYVRQVQDFYLVLVRNAGHVITEEQPRAALDMISRFVSGKPFQ